MDGQPRPCSHSQRLTGVFATNSASGVDCGSLVVDLAAYGGIVRASRGGGAMAIGGRHALRHAWTYQFDDRGVVVRQLARVSGVLRRIVGAFPGPLQRSQTWTGTHEGFGEPNPGQHQRLADLAR